MGGSTTTTSKSETDPAIKSRQLAFADLGLNLAKSPFQPYTGQRVADFSPTQLQAQQRITDIANNNVGADTLGQAKDVFGNLANYNASAITSPGTLSAQTVAPHLLSETDLSPYFNPYTKDVIDTALSDLERARQIQRVSDNQSATAGKAFGGSRQGVADSLTNAEYLRNVASTTAGLRNQGFLNAQNAAIGDLQRLFAADTANAGARQAADQFNIGTNLAVQNANAANDLSAAGLRGTAAGNLASLSNQELSQALQRAAALGSVGDAQQAQQQAINDAAFQEFLRQINDPLTKLAAAQGGVSLLPNDGTITQRQKNSPGALEIFSTLANGIGSLGGKPLSFLGG